MKKILLLAVLSLLLVLPACGGGVTNHAQASAYSQKYKQVVLFQGSIYKNGDKYGEYQMTNAGDETLVTYKNLDGKEVAVLTLKGISPKIGNLNIKEEGDTTLEMREYEIDVNEEDGAIYLIKNMILVKSEAKVVEAETEVKVENKEAIETLKNDHETAKMDMNVASDNSKPIAKVKVTGNVNGNIDLRYLFGKGNVTTYKSVENTTIKMSMASDMMGGMKMPGMDMGMTTKVMVETKFQLKILSVNSDKSANFETVIKSFKVYAMPSKTLIASDEGMRKLKAKGIITDKGQVRFLEDLFLVKTKDGQTLLVTGKTSNKNGKVSSSASATANGEKVEVQATFDSKTGVLTASTKRTKVKKISPKTVTLKKDDNKIDILPKRIMELFLLPENMLALGQTVEFTAPMMKVSFTANKGDGAKEVKLVSNFKTDKTNKLAGMDDEMMKMYPSIDAKVNGVFDTSEGVLKSINGDIKTKMEMPGMKIDITSDIKMNQLR